MGQSGIQNPQSGARAALPALANLCLCSLRSRVALGRTSRLPSSGQPPPEPRFLLKLLFLLLEPTQQLFIVLALTFNLLDELLHHLLDILLAVLTALALIGQHKQRPSMLVLQFVKSALQAVNLLLVKVPLPLAFLFQRV